MLSIKNNLSEHRRDGLAYRIIDSVVQWEVGRVNMSAQDYMSSHTPGPDPLIRNEAEEFLAELLSDGRVEASVIKELAKKNGISKSTLRRAKDELLIKTPKSRFW